MWSLLFKKKKGFSLPLKSQSPAGMTCYIICRAVFSKIKDFKMAAWSREPSASSSGVRGPVGPWGSHSLEALPMAECQCFVRCAFTMHPHFIKGLTEPPASWPSSHLVMKHVHTLAQLLPCLSAQLTCRDSSLEKDSHSVSLLNLLHFSPADLLVNRCQPSG